MRRLFCAPALLVLCLSATFGATTAAPEAIAVGKQVDQILAKLRRPSLDDVWTAQQQLQQLGKAAVPAIKSRLPKARPPQKVALAKALCALGHVGDAIAPLTQIIKAKDTRPFAVAAARILGQLPADAPPGDLQAAEDGLLALLEDRSLPPEVTRAVARALNFKASTVESIRRSNAALRKLLVSATDPDTRKACALALGEIDDFNPPVDAILKDLQDEPSARGRLARSLLQINNLRSLLIDPKSRDTEGLNDRLLKEIMGLMQRYHVEEPLPTNKLVDAAARGMVNAVRTGDHPDRHSAYFDDEGWRRFREQLTGHYGGIGAAVQFMKHFDTGDLPVFTIANPNYDGPAYKAGLRSFDRVVEVEGKSTAIQKLDDVPKKLKEIVAVLRGRPATTVEVTVTRPGSKERRKVQIVRADIDLPSVHQKLLPGKIGYVRLSSFGQQSARDLSKAIHDLERQGIVGLIFDLRSNPGGQLSISVQIADMFLKDNKLIVYTEGRNKRIARRENFRTKDPTTHPDYPLVVLVNGHSASASEIVSGALQDHKRAIVLGTTTFGKGSVQKLFPLHATSGRSGLKLTIAKYYLPSGRSIHGKGVAPTVKVPYKSTYSADEFAKLRENGAFYRYSASRYVAHKDLFVRLAEFDALDTGRYPDFDAWHKGLTDEIGRDKARRLLRAWLRLRVADDRGRRFVCDVEEDNQLRAAILEIAKRVEEVDPRLIPEYRFFAPQKDPKKAPEKAAAAP